MQVIILTGGQICLVDDEDYDYVNSFGSWYAHSEAGEYASHGRKPYILMHRIIMSAPDDKLVDHKDGNALDNQKRNLRICTRAENNRNRGKAKHNTSGYCGVRRHGKGFQARVRINGKYIHFGVHPTLEEAAVAYDIGALKHHGEFARLNFPEKNYTYAND